MILNKEKNKQIALISLSFILIGIGCLNFQKNQIIEVSTEDSKITNELNLGDVQLVNSEPVPENKYETGIVSNEELENVNKTPENVYSNIDANFKSEDIEQYFSETRLERDRMYSENIEIYQKMLENADVPIEQKAIATQEISNITNIKNGIMISENLIKNKGFDDVVILVNNGIASVILKTSLLTQEQVAKVQNIVSRELNIDVKNINISNK